jgi:hypothetical protein
VESEMKAGLREKPARMCMLSLRLDKLIFLAPVLYERVDYCVYIVYIAIVHDRELR